MLEQLHADQYLASQIHQISIFCKTAPLRFLSIEFVPTKWAPNILVLRVHAKPKLALRKLTFSKFTKTNLAARRFDPFRTNPKKCVFSKLASIH